MEKRVVSGESERPLSRGTGKVTDVSDRYGQDESLKLRWPIIHSVALFWAYANGQPDVPPEVRQEVASSLKSYFYYKESQIVKISVP